ncbi:Bug family tripartite tricarboxylate transporter substrate binding protein [Bordetella flabilis]|uniref:ABC transporter substrate-binding protein n=1 Tax=Bordetella flabilis TaxID=463014 RepID=A0A193GIQ3_9BORD|nr:tripartite tricarboxylate transporter substrate binding protein [Bordetella flabilis]ANN79301.1 ABC transporter substrate-binding protein [Bordetella flabilis]
MNYRKLLGLSLVTMALGAAAPACAQTAFPQGPMTLVIPFSPGGSTDVIGRLLAEKMGAALGQSVIVENRPGAGGNIGASLVARAKPDGHTLLLGTTGVLAVNEFIYANPGYSVERDLTPVAYTASISNVLIVNKDLPVTNVAELIKLAKAKPGQLSFASSGAGSSTHLSGELFKRMADVDIMHVPYKGSGQALVDLVGGQISMIFDNAPSAVPMAQSGKVKALAVTSMKPLPALPEAPTLDQAGLKGYESLSWTGIVAPKGTPPDVIAKLNATLNTILADKGVQQRMAELGAQTTGGTPQDFTAHMQAERAKWGKLVKEAGIKAN